MSSSIVFDPLSTNGSATSQTGTWINRIPDDNAFLQQVDRIMQSGELSGSDVLRRLLKFLAEKTVSGEADELKEYTVAIDGLGKPASYDPRHTSAVRIQAGRLRQKLIDYYRGEGSEDALVISLPKGHFRLSCRYCAGGQATDTASLHPMTPEFREVDEEHGARRTVGRMYFGPFLWVAIASIALNIYFWVGHPWNAKAADGSAISEMSPAMKELWGPFIASKRPLMLVLEDPLFVEFKTGGLGVYYRDKTVSSWSAVPGSTAIAKIRAALKNPSMQPSNYYTAFGEAHAAFLIGRLFGAHNQNFFSLMRASQMSPAQMAANNIITVGIPIRMFNNQLQSMPVQSEFTFESEGIKNLHPRPGESSLYADQFSTAPTEEGVAYALVSHFPGPLRNTDVEMFVGNRAAGYVAAVQAFVDPDFAREVVAKLRQESGGNIPRYYQVLLKVTFTNSVPTETTCVVVRKLT